MPLKAVVSELESVPEAARALYVERDGVHVLDVEAVETGGKRWSLEEVGGLKSALQRERGERERLAKTVAEFGDLTPAKAREALEQVKRFSELDPSKELDEKIAAHRRELEERYEKKRRAEIEPLTARLAKRESQLEKTLKSGAIRAALLEKGALPEDLDYLEFHTSRHVEMQEQDEQYVPRVVGSNGSPLISMKVGSVDAMGIDELIDFEIRPKYQRHFLGENASGSGSSQNNSANTNGSSGYRLSREDAQDPAKYRAAKEAAQKAGAQIVIL